MKMAPTFGDPWIREKEREKGQLFTDAFIICFTVLRTEQWFTDLYGLLMFSLLI